MINSLHISNYAIIDQIDLNLDKGLTVITGETGAGKSILLGALGLVLGNRADTSVLYDAKKKCIVEAIFDIGKYNLKTVFEEEDLDYDPKCIIRREINAQGKSRAFVNDTPATLSTLRKISENLVDLHQQFDTLEINQEKSQLELIDALIRDDNTFTKYGEAFRKYTANVRRLDELQKQSEDAAREMDFLRFQFDELETLAIEEGELADLEQEFHRMQNSEDIRITGNQVSETLDNGEYSVYNTLAELHRSLEKIAPFDPKASQLAERVYSVREEISDISQEALKMSEHADNDQERLVYLEERLDNINRLLTKHRVQTDTELLTIYHEISSKLSAFESTDEEIESLNQENAALEVLLEELASNISVKRKQSAQKLEKAVKEKLEQLSMPNAELIISIEKSPRFRRQGKDEIRFLFSANKGIDALPLNKVASGGELSRLNLAIKSIVAGAVTLPSLIFDEIDTGVSGNVSLKMGKLLKSLSREHQTIVITHSPQIAAIGDHHFFIYKFDENNRTKTSMRSLVNSEKKIEIAKMLSGDPPTEAAIKNAEELMSFS